MPLLIYTTSVSPRIKYIFNFIFREILRCDFEFTSAKQTFLAYQGPKFSYAKTALADELFFEADGLLNEHGIGKIDLKLGTFGGQKVPFSVTTGELPFDMFAASFYFVSRYEEYLDHEPDHHLRFPAKLSLQYELNLLKTPVIDEWSLILKNLLINKIPNIQFGTRAFQYIPTIDIDRAYHFKSSGLLKNFARFLFATYKRDKEKLSNIIKTGLGTKTDPYDTYDILSQLHLQHKLEPIFFFLLAHKGNKEHDVNIKPQNELLQELILRLSKQAKIGIHPSYASNVTIEKVKQEKHFLEQLIQKKIVDSRQHYLKLHLPKTYLELSAASIFHDYTMGYASELGFRAGTCTPFFWYDLQLEKQSPLKVHPFAIMDVTLRQYVGLSPEEAIATIAEMMNSVKMVNGTFYSVWHNEALSETGVWKGWRKVYAKLLENATTT